MIRTKLRNLYEASSMGRQVGKTTALMQAAISIGATFVCANKDHESLIRRGYEKSILPTITSAQDIRGTKGPYVWDHFAIERIAAEADSEIGRLESRNANFINALESARAIIDRALAQAARGPDEGT